MLADGIRFILVASMLIGCSPINKKLGLPDDNIIEESAEAILKAESGIDIDFTPSSPEFQDPHF